MTNFELTYTCSMLLLACRCSSGFTVKLPLRRHRTALIVTQLQFANKTLQQAVRDDGNEMTLFEQDLYDDLIQLCDDENNGFIYRDFQKKDRCFRIFDFRRASYSDFVRKGALNCRGTMFAMNGLQPSRLASLPMEKFFNLNENPFTMDLDLSTINKAEAKADGSLISTYICNDELSLKTRFSISSSQCIAAMAWLEERSTFKHELQSVVRSGYTVNMEWCSPDNRIVLPYPEPVLTVLNIRNHATGAYVDVERLEDEFGSNTLEIKKQWVEQHSVPDWKYWVEQEVLDQKDIEGYVLHFESGMLAKLKTKWYSALHTSKAMATNSRELFGIVVDGMSDDLRARFYDDERVVHLIDEMESIVNPAYNRLVQSVTDFYESNKNLDRKEYMIKGQRELAKDDFGIAARLYLGKDVDFQKAMKSRWDQIKTKLS